MCRKMVVLIFFVLMLGSVSNAEDIKWTDLGADHLWSTPENWDLGRVPTLADDVLIDVPAAAAPNGPVIQDGIAAECHGIWTEAPGEPMLTITGGSLVVADWIWWGDGADSFGIWDMSGGTVDVANEFELGWGGGAGTLTMTGGTINARKAKIPTGSAAFGELFLYGGTYNVTGEGELDVKDNGLIDITEGTLVLEGDDTVKVNDLIAAGQITAYGSSGQFELDFDVSNPGKTTLTAVEPVSPVDVQVDNLLANGGFEDGVMEPWTTYGNVTSEVVTELVDAVIPESPAEGDYCLHVVVPEAGANSWDAGLQNAGHVFEEGKKYTLSAFVKSKAGTLDIHFKPEIAVDPWSGYSDTTFTMTEEWTEFSVTTEVFGSDVSPASITFHIAFAAGDFWVDGVRWYEGDYVAPPVTINVDPDGDIAAANEFAMPGDTIEIAEGTYVLTEAIEIKDGVTYRGAGAGLTIIDGNDVTRAFTAWGDRGATNGQVDENGDGVQNATGQTGWVLEGLTIQNCASDTENRQDILSAARDLLNNYTGTPYTLATAQEENGGITNNPGWFDILSGGADDDLTDAELQAYLDANPVGSEGHLVVNDDKRDDGGAVLILNGADGTIRNCEFSNNTADDDGGAILVNGQALVVAIEDCTFNLNSCGDVGGAVSLSGANSNSTVTGCSFTDCTADDDGGAIKMEGAGDGGSIYTVTDCTFTGCSASDDGGAIFANGDRSSYVWTDCTFTGNYSGDDGAAVKYAPDNADMTVTNCAFIGNGKDADGAVVNDDSVWQTNDDDAGSLTFNNCLFADNEVKDDRLVEVKAVFAFQNCTFANNVVGDKTIIAIRGRAWNSTGNVDENGDDIDDVFTDASVVNNCLFINNTTDGDVIGDNRKDDGVFGVTVTNCLFYGNVDLNGTDPADNVRDVIVEVGTIDVSAVTDAAQIVVDPAGDYHLAVGSAAIDASDPATATDADIEGTAAVGVRDVGAYESAN